MHDTGYLTTKIWNTPWLPSTDTGCITTVMHVELQDATVQGLINVDTGEWDSDVLRDICNDRDRELILRVPFPSRRREDSWFWLLDDKGKFTFKSVYRSLQGENNMEDSSFWRKLWSLGKC